MAPRRTLAALVAVALASSGCSLLATPTPPSVRDASLAPSGPMGYVACPSAVSPVELDTGTPEAPISLPLAQPAPLGNFAIAASADGRRAYVVATVGGASGPPPAAPGTPQSTTAATGTTGTGAAGTSEVVPVDLVGQRAEPPIPIPALGGTHAIVVLPGGRRVLAGDGTAIVPVDAASRRVGAPLDLGPGHTVYGLALAPDGSILYALVPGGVFVVDTVHWTTGPEISTGLAISSVYSPHGIAVTADGTTVYVVGQGGTDFGGRLLPIAAATRTPLPVTGFDKYGIADPAALAVAPDGASMLVVDSANNWINPVVTATFTDPPAPVPLPARPGSAPGSGTGHPTDIVFGPAATDAFVVEGFGTLLPYQPATQHFGRPITVCTGASSMVVAPAP